MERKKEIPAMTSQNGTGAERARFQPYAPLLEKAGIPFSIHKPWLLVGKADYNERWVICLSICIKDAETIFQRVFPILKERKVAFSMIADQLQHNRINNHAFPSPLFGKVLQIFPDTPANAVILAQELAQVTNLFSGVFIPGCIRLGGILYATYSTKNTDFDPQNPNSLPFRFNTNEIPIPFPSTIVREEHAPNRFLKKRYLPVKLIRSSHKGNILKGLDLYKLNWVFIKQANSWAGEDIYGREMRDRLCWQREVADRLEDVVHTPKMLDFIDQEGYSYLITEYCDGVPFEDMILSRKTSKEAFERILEYYYQVLIMVSNMHSLDYVHRDLTAKNILIHDGCTFLTDFELAYRLGEDIPPFASGTIGYMSPEQKRNERPCIAEDMYTLGALLYYILSRETPKALDNDDDAQLEERLSLLDCPEPLKEAARGCLLRPADKRWEMARLMSAIEPFLPTPKQRKDEAKRNIWLVTKRKLIISGAIMLLGCLTVIILWRTSDEPNGRDNRFMRKFLYEDLVPLNEISLPKETRYIAGLVGDSLYFSTPIPGEVRILHLLSKKMENRHLITDTSVRNKLHGSAILQVDRFGIALFDGNARLMVLKGSGEKPRIQKVSELFSRAVRFSAHSIAMRKFKPGVRDQYFYRYDLIKGEALNESQVTEPADDGGLVTGGFLDFNSSSVLGAYVAKYANHITLLDTNMRILRTGHTIDTFRNYTLQSQLVLGGKGAQITNGGPAYYVNNGMAMDKSRIYVYSNLKADNETTYQFMSSNVIDVYRTADLSYQESYRLPTKEKRRIRNFKIVEDKLYVLYPNLLQVYLLPNQQSPEKTAGL